jgi:hypothetical protein
MDQLTERALRVATMRGAASADVRTVRWPDERISVQTVRIGHAPRRESRRRRLPAGAPGAPRACVVPGVRVGPRNLTGGTEH